MKHIEAYFNETFCRHIVGKYSNMKFYENSSSGSRVVPFGQRDDRQTDMTKLIVALPSSANAPEKVKESSAI
jgi:hypothetical protein